MEVYRTPDAAFEELPDFPWEAAYAQVADPDGGTLRVAYVDAGPAEGRSRSCCTVSLRGRSSTGT